MMVASACVGLLLLLVYEGWAVRHGFLAWNVLSSGAGEMATPSWRKLWWWILLSSTALIGGIMISNVIQQAMS